MRTFVLAAALAAPALVAPAPAAAQSSIFTANEIRAADMKDHLRRIRETFKDGSAPNRKITAQITQALSGSDDWRKTAEAYYALSRGLVARAAALESQLDSRMAANTTDEADKVRRATEDILKKCEVLRSDYEFYSRLPVLATGPDGKVAQAAMRLLAQTGEYPVALAYYLNRARDAGPFAPLSPARTLSRLPE